MAYIVHVAATETPRNNGEWRQIFGDAPVPAAYARTADGCDGTDRRRRLGLRREEFVDRCPKPLGVAVIRRSRRDHQQDQDQRNRLSDLNTLPFKALGWQDYAANLS